MMTDQKLVARIKRNSKYWGQTPANQWFDVRISDGSDHYCVRGNGNAYRIADVAFGVRRVDGTVVDISPVRAR